MRYPLRLTAVILLTVITSGCQEEPPAVAVTPEPAVFLTQSVATVDNSAILAPQTEEAPPQPPLYEDFQGQPQLSLFPRAGGFRPAVDSDQLPYWETFIEHLVKMTGVAVDQASGDRAWVFRGINTVDSVGYFSPLAVTPQTTYDVSFRITSDLVAGASAGIGIIEFDEFLWIADQFTEEIHKKHALGAKEGQRLTGKNDRLKQAFTFTTSPQTKMIHLILYREGAHDRNNVLFDEIRIEQGAKP